MQHGRRRADRLRLGLERRGWFGALAVLAVVLVYLLVPSAVNAHVADPARVLDTGDSAQLDAPGDESAKLDLSPLAGWTRRVTASSDTLVAIRGQSRVSLRLVTGIEDQAVAFDRLPRVLRMSSWSAHWSRTGEFRTGRGLTGYRGDFSTGKTTGSLFLAGRDGTALFAIVSAPAADLTAATDAAESVLQSAEVTS